MLLSRKLWFSDKECRICGKRSPLVSEAIGVCLECLRSDPKAVEVALEGHRRERLSLGLPPEPPRRGRTAAGSPRAAWATAGSLRTKGAG